MSLQALTHVLCTIPPNPSNQSYFNVTFMFFFLFLQTQNLFSNLPEDELNQKVCRCLFHPPALMPLRPYILVKFHQEDVSSSDYRAIQMSQVSAFRSFTIAIIIVRMVILKNNYDNDKKNTVEPAILRSHKT